MRKNRSDKKYGKLVGNRRNYEENITLYSQILVAYVAAILCTIIAVSLDMASPLVTQRIIDNLIVGGEMDLLPKLLIIVLCIGIGRCIYHYLKN
jgi:ABC-type bacteriocin/lantibiotic exporter with double-glycine peptidase domain